MMRWDLLISDCEQVFVINGKEHGAGHLRAGVLVCVNTTQSVVRFTLEAEVLQLLIPKGCLDAGQITKTFNLDLPILQRHEQVRLPDSR